MNSIESLKLDTVIEALVTREGWRLRDAEEVAGLYRNYLYLSVKYPEKQFPPSEDVDEFWHTHILDTAKYRADCEVIFGHYFDHKPSMKSVDLSSSNELSAGFQEFQVLHYQEFGDYVYEVRGRLQKLISLCKKLFKKG